jgi:hypothetical protein
MQIRLEPRTESKCVKDALNDSYLLFNKVEKQCSIIGIETRSSSRLLAALIPNGESIPTYVTNWRISATTPSLG